MNEDDQRFVGAGCRVRVIADIVKFEPVAESENPMRETCILLGEIPEPIAGYPV